MRGALRQMARYRLRSALVMACAALGVGGAVAAVNYASGGRAQVLDQIRRLGTNLVIVSAEQSRSVALRARTGAIVTTLVPADYDAIRGQVEGIAQSSAIVTANLRLKAGYLSKVAIVAGVEPPFFPMKAWALSAGSAFDAEDVRRSARVAVIGAQVARDLFGDAAGAVGERLFINRVPFDVVGVLTERGFALDGTNEDGRVFVPLTTAMRRLADVEHFDAVLLEIARPDRLTPASAEITALLRTRHRISAFRPDDFRVQSQTDLINTQLAAADRLDFFVRWIGLSALLVAGLGILAIAWIAVRDRRNEIGTRRAIGATSADVFFQFAFEAAVLAAGGAVIGLAVGYALSKFTAVQAGLPFVFDLPNAVLALAVALLLNLLFASGPALRAARLDPIRALRGE